MNDNQREFDNVIESIEKAFVSLNDGKMPDRFEFIASICTTIYIDRQFQISFSDTELLSIQKKYENKKVEIDLNLFSIIQIRKVCAKSNVLLLCKKGVVNNLLIRLLNKENLSLFLQIGFFSMLSPSKSIHRNMKLEK